MWCCLAEVLCHFGNERAFKNGRFSIQKANSVTKQWHKAQGKKIIEWKTIRWIWAFFCWFIPEWRTRDRKHHRTTLISKLAMMSGLVELLRFYYSMSIRIFSTWFLRRPHVCTMYILQSLIVFLHANEYYGSVMFQSDFAASKFTQIVNST